MKSIKKKICLLSLFTITLSSICILSSSCASSSSSMGEPVGLYKYSQRRSNIVRSNVKVKDASPSKNRSNKKKY